MKQTVEHQGQIYASHEFFMTKMFPESYALIAEFFRKGLFSAIVSGDTTYFKVSEVEDTLDTVDARQQAKP